MPVIFLERLPLPSIQTYTTLSVGLFSFAILYAHRQIADYEELMQSSKENTSDSLGTLPSNRNYFTNIASILLGEAWSIWIIINMAYCVLLLFGRLIQQVIFGDLRISEQEHLKDKFWNFVFYKFIFIFGVMNVQTMDEVFMWCAWFSVLCFLQMLAQLCKDRFEYLSFSLSTPKATHVKVLSLLSAILLSCTGLLLLCVYVGLEAGLHVFGFMAAECVLLGINVIYVLIRYSVHLWDLHHEGLWENRSKYTYYSELICELATVSVDFIHHLHMLLWSNIFLSMASLVICMQLRYLFHEFQRRIKRHKNFQRVVQTMQTRFPMATQEELSDRDDKCAICWENLTSGRKLTCNHIFHEFCLRSWLEQDVSCPTCREPLNLTETEQQPQPEEREANMDGAVPGEAGAMGNQNFTNHFFHFDGSRYIRWLPSFSVEVTHTRILGAQQNQPPVQTSQMDTWVRQVRDIFPDTSMPDSVIMDDLQVTRSPELTVDNILEGRLVQQAVPLPLPQGISRPGARALEAVMQQRLEGTNTLDQYSLPDPGSSGGQQYNNILRDENLPDLYEEMDDDTPTPPAPHSGGRFSKNSSEREVILTQRREELLEQARRRFQAREVNNGASSSSSSSASSSSSSSSQPSYSQVSQEDLNLYTSTEMRHRRELAYRAAQRRMMQGNQD